MRHRPAPRRVRGLTLIEVMVSVLVLGIGLLGIAALQASALRNSQSSLERSQAVIGAYSIIDAMRANIDPTTRRPFAVQGVYNIGMTCVAPPLGALTANDQNAWITGLQQSLGPSACGLINCVGAQCTVTVQWDDSRGTGGAAAQSLSVQTQL